MQAARVIALFVLLPLVLAFDRGGYYSMRSGLSFSVLEAGGSRQTLSTVFSIIQVSNVVGLIFAALVGILIRPIWLVVSGALVALLGYGVLATVSASAATYVGIVLVAGGLALSRPALFALGASEIGHPREQLRAALFVLLYGTVNAGALFASLTSGPLRAISGGRTPFLVGAASQLIVVVLSCILFGVLFATKNDQPEPAKDAPKSGRVVLGAALLGLVLVPYLVETMLTSQAEPDILRKAGVASVTISALLGLNPSVVMLSSGLLFAASLILHFVVKSLPSLYATCAGLCLAGLASTPFVLLSSSSSSSGLIPILMLGIVGLAICETLVSPYALSRMLGDVSPRFVTAVASGWFILTALTSTAVSYLASALPAAVPFVVAASALFCLALGVGGIFAVRPMYRRIFALAPSPADPQ